MASNIIVLGFPEGQYLAEGMLGTIMQLQEEGLLVVDDAVIASRGVGENVNIKQTQSETGKFSLRGGGIGLLAGILLGGPIGGLVAGTAMGAIAGKMKDAGIDDDFIKGITAGLSPNSSMLFLMVEKVDPDKRDKLESELRKYKAVVLETTLSDDNEAELRELFAKDEYGDK